MLHIQPQVLNFDIAYTVTTVDGSTIAKRHEVCKGGRVLEGMHLSPPSRKEMPQRRVPSRQADEGTAVKRSRTQLSRVHQTAA